MGAEFSLDLTKVRNPKDLRPGRCLRLLGGAGSEVKERPSRPALVGQERHGGRGQIGRAHV